jgi:hypothetical protein
LWPRKKNRPGQRLKMRSIGARNRNPEGPQTFPGAAKFQKFTGMAGCFLWVIFLLQPVMIQPIVKLERRYSNREKDQ